MQRSKDEQPEERRERKRLIKEARVSARLQAIAVRRLCMFSPCLLQTGASQHCCLICAERRPGEKEGPQDHL